MEYATLNNGVKMPMAGIGTFLLTPDEAEASVLSALQCGYRLIDTANAYVNEKAVGRAMKKSGVEREDIFLETKLWPSFYEQAGRGGQDPGAPGHRLYRPAADPPARRQLCGRVQADGEGLQRGQGEGHRPVQLQHQADPGDPGHLRGEARRPPDGGPPLLPGEGTEEPSCPTRASSSRPGIPWATGTRRFSRSLCSRNLRKKYGKSNAQIILRWHIQAGNIVIPGSKNPEHIKANLDLFDFALTDEEMAKIAAMDKKQRYYHSTPETAEAVRGNGAPCG